MGGGAHRACQDDPAVHGAGRNAAGRQQGAQRTVEPAEVVRDDDPRVGDHVVVRVERVERGLPRPLAEQVDHARRLDVDVGDLGIGDEDRGRRLVQPDQLAFVDLERQALVARADLSGLGQSAPGRRRQHPQREQRNGRQGGLKRVHCLHFASSASVLVCSCDFLSSWSKICPTLCCWTTPPRTTDTTLSSLLGQRTRRLASESHV